MITNIIAVIILTVITVDAFKKFSHTRHLLLLPLESIKAAVRGLILLLSVFGSEEHFRLFTIETVFST
jgi:hypothetical protein